MAETTNLNIRIDKGLKEQAEVFFNELGLNMSSAFNIFVRQSLRQGKIPFELSVVADPKLTIDEQIREAALRRNPKRVKLQTDESGSVIVDKDKHPDIYDWAVNG
ncbi:MAG: type II toxin-antitoxin system RelB/DinJ family antitoxin [Defluviitaleaceae bacterium]|nr:type II toxin-antitoxin system RelB/DinJ family antitoxin [Defluviitaleaceae bacterium]